MKECIAMQVGQLTSRVLRGNSAMHSSLWPQHKNSKPDKISHIYINVRIFLIRI